MHLSQNVISITVATMYWVTYKNIGNANNRSKRTSNHRRRRMKHVGDNQHVINPLNTRAFVDPLCKYRGARGGTVG